SLHNSAMHAVIQSGQGEPLPEAGYQALRRVSRAITAHREVKDLFRSLADELRPVVNFVFLRVFYMRRSGTGCACTSARRPDIPFLGLVADQIAVAIDDALHSQQLQQTKSELEQRNQRLQLLLDVNNSIAANLQLRDLLLAISANVRRVMQADFVGVALPDPS